MKIYFLVFTFSTFFFSLNLLIFPLLRSFFLDFPSPLHKKYVFLLCNGILVFVVRNSGVLGSYSERYAEEAVETEDECIGKGERELAMETRETEEERKDIHGDEKERETENEDDEKELEMEEDDEKQLEMEEDEEEEEEEEESGEVLSAEELRRKCEDFIRRVKEEMRYESKQLTIVNLGELKANTNYCSDS